MVGFKKLFLWQKNKDPVSGTLLCIIYYLFYTLSVCNDVYSNVLSCMSAYCNVLSKNVPLAFWTIKLNHYNTISICDNILARSLTDFWRSDWFLKKWLIFVKRLIDDVINLPIKRTLRRYQSITSRVDLRKQLQASLIFYAGSTEEISGTWCQIHHGEYALPDQSNKETSVDGVFYTDDVRR